MWENVAIRFIILLVRLQVQVLAETLCGNGAPDADKLFSKES